MLYFHIANRYRGIDILDDVMRRYKKARFYILNIKPTNDQALMPVLYCFPRSVIGTYIRDIVEDHCGAITADLVENYLVYRQHNFDQVQESVGLESNICDSDFSSDMVTSRPPIPSSHTKLGVSGLLEFTAHGTAPDTLYGKEIMAFLQSLSGEDLCTTENSGLAYYACFLSSDEYSEKNRFNIVQFAHQLVPFLYHGTQCNRLEQFTACWNVLQQTCGPKVQGLAQHATLLVEGCKIQSEMDIAGCPWQDMLLGYYVQASRITRWPTSGQCLENSMLIDSSRYSSFNDLVDDLETVISLLQPGVEEITMKCGSQTGKRLALLLNRLRYLQPDALKYAGDLFPGGRMASLKILI